MNKIRNLIVFIIVFAFLGSAFEYGAYKTQSDRLVRQGYKLQNGVAPYPKNIKTFSDYYNNDFDKKFNLKVVSGEQFKTPSILVFGDVLSKSVEHQNENDFNNVLSNITKQPVYNFSNAGWGIQHMYFLLSNEKELNNLNPDTIIYTYNNDNKNRLTSFSFYPHHSFLNLRYKLVDNKVKEYNPLILKIYDLYFVRAIERFFGWRFSTSKNSLVQRKNYALIRSLFENSREVAQKKYPNLKKFIIIRDVPAFESINFLNQSRKHNRIAEIEYYMWQDLISEGFIVIDTNELVDFDTINYSYKNKDGSFSADALKAFLPDVLNRAGILSDNKTQQIYKDIRTAKNGKILFSGNKITYNKMNKSVSSRVSKSKVTSKSCKNNDAWSQIRPEVIGNNFFGYNFHSEDNAQEINISEKKPKKSFWSKLKFWNKFKKKKA